MIDMGRPRAGALTSGRPPDFILVKFAVFDAHLGGPAGALAARKRTGKGRWQWVLGPLRPEMASVDLKTKTVHYFTSKK